MTRTERAALAAACALAACARGDLGPGPAPASVDPPTGASTAPVPIVIRGERFHVRAALDAAGGATVDAAYRAWLDGTPLDGVTWEGEDTLRAIVPAGLAPGAHALTVEDPFGRRGTLAAAYTAILPPAALALRFVDLPARVNVGRPFVATAEVSNPGGAAAVGVSVSMTSSPAGGEGPAPAPADVAGGATFRASRTFTPSTPGAVDLRAGAAGTDGASGAAVAAAPVSATLVAERPAALAAALSLPSPVETGDVAVELAVTNVGEAVALDVAAGPLALSGAAATVVSPPPPGPAGPLGPGETARFAWTVRAPVEGTLRVDASASARDANDGTALLASASASATVREAVVLAADPLGDGSPFAFVVAHAGKVYVGPNRDGSGMVRLDPDGTAAEPVSLSFERDVTGGNVSAGTVTPYASIGHTGCAGTRADPCGPDREDGRGLLASFTLGGEEWLLLGGARSDGDLDYVYATRDAGTAPVFSYVDLSGFLGDNTRGLSAAAVVADRLYLGFPDNGSKRPYGVALPALPAGAGLDATAADAIRLQLSDAYAALPGADLQAIAMVDTVAAFRGRALFLNDVGCLVSTTSHPEGPADLGDCSPAIGPSYDPTRSLAPTRQYDLGPRDRAWPQAAEWSGRLYAIRNTYDGPQLWVCDPAGGADPDACDPGDWSPIAADGTGTLLGAATADAATLLVATPSHLWIGLDDPVRGVQLYRTAAADPRTPADFSGFGGCAAGTAGCAGVGGDGLGAPAATRILDGKALSFPGRTGLYLTVGDGAAPARLVRLGN
jgi:hypothetical protein